MIYWEKSKERNEAVSELPQRLFSSELNPMATHIHDYWSFDVEMRNN